MALVEKIDHVETGVGRLLSQFKSSPILWELLTIYLEQSQEVEEVLFQLLTERSIFTAVGEQLDVIGLLFNVGRLGRDDETYRAALFDGIAKDAGSGTIPEIVESLRLVASADTARIFEHYPAEFHASVSSDVNEDVVRTLQEIKGAGINASRVYFKQGLNTLVGSERFTFQDFLLANNLDNLVTDQLQAFEVSFNKTIIQEQSNSVPAELPYERGYIVTDTESIIAMGNGDRLIYQTAPTRPATGNSPLSELINIENI